MLCAQCQSAAEPKNQSAEAQSQKTQYGEKHNTIKTQYEKINFKKRTKERPCTIEPKSFALMN